MQTLKEHPTVILMCGLAFSGKTTLARAIVSDLGWAYINLDEINAERGLYGGDGIEAEEWERTHHIALQSLQKELASGNSGVVDDTNCFRWIRDRFRDLSRANHARTTVVLVDTPIHEIEERIAHNRDVRGRKGIQAPIFAAHVAAFERPADDEEVLVYNSNDDPTALDKAALAEATRCRISARHPEVSTGATRGKRNQVSPQVRREQMGLRRDRGDRWPLT